MTDPTNPVRVRIAPSPTGHCHVGTARNALYNLLFARQHQGRFVLRIDDTDRKRSTERSERGILEGLQWLGLRWDEGPDVGGPYGPYRQSERLDLYRDHVERLLDSGRAYHCFCTAEELAEQRRDALSGGRPPRYDGRCGLLSASEVQARLRAGRPSVVRLRLAPRRMVLEDLVQGRVEQNAELMGDPVIVKSDRMPTYHFATIVDEHMMKISHVIRGVEHLNNTFPQLQMYEALGFDPPAFAHIGLLLNPDRSKISKRTGAVYIGEFREKGYLPEAMLNHLALSGWSPGSDRELFSFEELHAAFSLDRCSPSNAIYDRGKLLWMNAYYIRQLPVPDLTRRVLPLVSAEEPIPATNPSELETERMERIVALVRERMRTLAEAPDLLSFFYHDPDPKGCLELLGQDRFTRRHTWAVLQTALAATCETLATLSSDEWTSEGLACVLDAQLHALRWQRRDLYMALRISVTGRQATPSLHETLEAIGREATLRRLNAVIG